MQLSHAWQCVQREAQKNLGEREGLKKEAPTPPPPRALKFSGA